MVELFIDGCLCDLGAVPTLPIGFDAERLTDAEGGRQGRTIEFEIPSTPKNDALLGSSKDLYATSRFNGEHHSAAIVCDGLTLFEGTLHLLATDLSTGYKLRLVEGGYGWIDRAVSATVDKLPIDYNDILTLSRIQMSWRDGTPVKFLPVYRGDYKMRASSGSVHPVENILLTDDYHPFISVAEMVRKMFDGYGYTLRSNFLNGELFNSLYMSGSYAHNDLSSDSEKCDFLARRAAPVTATADSTGRVHATTAFATHTVKNIVDTANPTAIDYEGKLMSDTFSNNGCFTYDEFGRIIFKPITSVNVGFVLHAEYTTDYKIETRERLKGFDTFSGLNDVYVEYMLTNSFEDFRDNVLSRMLYRAVVFDHNEEYEYRLVELLPTGELFTMGEWSARSAQVLSSESTAITSATLYYRKVGDKMWDLYTDDWALYAGHIEETGTVDVEMTVRMPPKTLNAGDELLLDKFWFGGAEKDMNFTLGTGTSLRPYFTNVAGYGSLLTFADIAPKQLRQIDLLHALAQMFNLAFITNEERKEVRIEPLEDLYADKVVDWTERIDLAQPITLWDTGIDRPQNYVLSYIDADKASHIYNLDNDTTLGSWRWRNSLYGTTNSTKRLANKLFTTTLNIDNVLGCAPSASLMQVGDVTLDEAENYGYFTPHIVSYQGLVELPGDERWSGSATNSYPYAAFIDGARGINLCFEEREGVEGLARFYTESLHREECRQMVSLTLKLTPAEIVHLTKDDGPYPSVLSRYRFSILGESALFRLVQFEEWDPLQMTVKCVFQREMRD